MGLRIPLDAFPNLSVISHATETCAICPPIFSPLSNETLKELDLAAFPVVANKPTLAMVQPGDTPSFKVHSHWRVARSTKMNARSDPTDGWRHGGT